MSQLTTCAGRAARYLCCVFLVRYENYFRSRIALRFRETRHRLRRVGPLFDFIGKDGFRLDVNDDKLPPPSFIFGQSANPITAAAAKPKRAPTRAKGHRVETTVSVPPGENLARVWETVSDAPERAVTNNNASRFDDSACIDGARFLDISVSEASVDFCFRSRSSAIC